MVTLKRISLPELPSLVEFSYQGDSELLEKYHMKENMSFEDAVNAQMIMIKQAMQEVDVTLYKAIHDKQTIGYVVTFPHVLYSFAVNIHYRKAHILSELMNAIKKELNGGWVCVLYKNNTRAIQYLIKSGLELRENDLNNNTVNLVKI